MSTTTLSIYSLIVILLHRWQSRCCQPYKGSPYLFTWCIRRAKTNSSHWRIVKKVCTMMLVKWYSGRQWWTISVVTMATWRSFSGSKREEFSQLVCVIWSGMDFCVLRGSFLDFHETWGWISTFWGWDFLNLVFLWDFWIFVECFDIQQNNLKFCFLFK